MTGLKPCPFCQDGGKPRAFAEERFVGNPANGIVEMDEWVTCMVCGASADMKTWNTRAERTCKIERVEHDEYGEYYYTSCGHCTISHSHVPCFCSECGARVVGHERRNMSDKKNICEGCSRFDDRDYCWSCSRNFPDMYKTKAVE